jgi:hypothetical protein
MFCKYFATHYPWMMKVLRHIPFVAIAGLYCTPAQAMTDDAICALVHDLSPYIAENEYLAPLEGCPKITRDIPDQPGLARSQAGAYDPLTGAIALAPDLDLTAAYGQSYLLHELVHAAQFQAGRDKTMPCHAALEGEAYQIQASYLMQHGLTREAVLIRLMADQLSACGMSDRDY